MKNGIDIDRLNNLSCCDAVTIVLEAKGLLNEKIEGLVTCKCKKKLMRFSANVDLKEITLDFMEEMK